MLILKRYSHISSLKLIRHTGLIISIIGVLFLLIGCPPITSDETALIRFLYHGPTIQ